MAIKLIHNAGTDQELEAIGPLTNLILQDPKGITQQDDMGGTVINLGADGANNKASFGTPFMIEMVVNAEDLSGAASDVLSALGGLDLFPTFDAAVANTGSPFKFKILDAWVVTLTENVQTAADTLMVQKLDADGSTQTDITDAMDLNVADSIKVNAATIAQDACVIDVTENVRLDIVLGSASDDRAYKVYLSCMRCIADE